MNLLVACHCKERDEQIYYKKVYVDEIGDVTLYDKRKIEDKFNVEYIDIFCEKEEAQWNKWDEIPLNSKDVILVYGCSIYGALLKGPSRGIGSEETGVIRNLFQDGWNLLKPGGTILVPIYKLWEIGPISLDFEAQTKRLRELITRFSSHGWVVRAHDVASLPYILGTKREWGSGGQAIDNLAYLSVTKPASGGRRKTLKNRRRK